MFTIIIHRYRNMIETMCNNPGLVEIMQQDLAKNGSLSKWTVDKVIYSTLYCFFFFVNTKKKTNSEIYRAAPHKVQIAVYREIMSEKLTSQGKFNVNSTKILKYIILFYKIYSDSFL